MSPRIRFDRERRAIISENYPVAVLEDGRWTVSTAAECPVPMETLNQAIDIFNSLYDGSDPDELARFLEASIWGVE
jgi:hypothetical protein